MPPANPIRRYSDYDAEAREVLTRAANLAEAEGSTWLGTAHLLRGLIGTSPGLAGALAEEGIVEAAIAGLPTDEKGERGVTRAVTSVFGAAEAEALLHGRRVVTPSDLLAGLKKTPSPVSVLLAAERSRDIHQR